MKSEGTFYTFRLQPDADLRHEILSFVQSRQVEAAAVVTCVGSLRAACLRLANETLPEPYDGPFEIVSLVGTAGKGGAHFHLSLADATGRVIGGHMREGCIIHTTAEIVIVSFVDLVFDRTEDPQTGFKELVVLGGR